MCFFLFEAVGALKFENEVADKKCGKIMGTQAQAAAAEESVPSVARQPILCADERVFGYELLFKQSPQEQPLPRNAQRETCAIVDTLNLIGLGVLCDGRRAFIHCTHEMLLMEYFALLPAGVVLEIQKSVPVDEAVVAVCGRLKQAGYMMALDDFGPSDSRGALVHYADFIKVNIKKIPLAEIATMMAPYGDQRYQMLAQGVETRQDFATARKRGLTRVSRLFFSSYRIFAGPQHSRKPSCIPSPAASRF